MKKGMGERWAEFWGISKELVMNMPRISLAGNREAYIENHKGIALYNDETVIIKTPSGNVTFCGTQLRVDTLNPDEMFISGIFKTISFDFNGEIKNVK